jgi:hypothetical protein
MEHDVQYVGSHPTKDSKEIAWYVTGFTDGEGCFSVSFNRRAKLKTGIEVRPSFCLAQNKRSLEVLKTIHTYFGCGAIRFSKHDQMYKYEVRSIKDLRERIIPHFQKYPLRTNKAQDFLIFTEVCELIASSHHLNPEYLERLIQRAYLMNEAGLRRVTQEELLKFLVR